MLSSLPLGRLDTMHRCTLGALVLLIGAAQAAIHHTAIHADTRKLVHFSESFGFSKYGILELQLKDLKIYRQSSSKAALASEINLDEFGFFIAPSDADIKLEQEDTPKHCSLPTPHETYGKILFRFNDADVQTLLYSGLAENGSPAFVLNKDFQFPKGGLLKLHFANCEPDTAVSFKARIAMYNLDSDGRKVYLPVGQTELTAVYWVLFGLFAAATAVWARLLHKTHDHMRSITLLVLSLGGLKALALLCTAAARQRTASTGQPGGWSIAHDVAWALMLLNTLVLVAAGWLHMRPVLGDRHRKLLATAIPCLLSATIATAVADRVLANPAAFGDRWLALRDAASVVDIVGLCALLFPIKQHLRQYYAMAAAYIYFSRVVAFIVCSAVSLQYVCVAASELPALALYVWAAVASWPREPSPGAAPACEEADDVRYKLDAPLLPCQPGLQAPASSA